MLVVSRCPDDIIQLISYQFISLQISTCSKSHISLAYTILHLIPDPDINLFSIIYVDSCCGLIDGLDGLLNLPASVFTIKSPLFSAAFLPVVYLYS